MTCKLTVQNRQAKVTVIPSAAALVIKALKEPARNRKLVRCAALRWADGPGPGLGVGSWLRHRAWRGRAEPCPARVWAPLAPDPPSLAPLSQPPCLSQQPPPPRREQEKNVKHNGNLTIDDVYEVARVMADRSCAATFAGTVKEMLGTCVSVGCTVEGEDPRDIQKKIDDGEIVW